MKIVFTVLGIFIIRLVIESVVPEPHLLMTISCCISSYNSSFTVRVFGIFSLRELVILVSMIG